jgi:hypothetical protein
MDIALSLAEMYTLPPNVRGAVCHVAGDPIPVAPRR